MSFRVSYSILQRYSSGDARGAVGMWLHLPTYKSSSMHAGSEMHNEWQQYIEANKKLPDIFGSQPRPGAICEKKLEVDVSGGLTLVGVPDCISGTVLDEFKTGSRDTSADSYASSYQPGYYALVCMYAGIRIDYALIHHYNFTSRVVTTALVWITPALMNKTYLWIVHNALGLRTYITDNWEAIKQIRVESNER